MPLERPAAQSSAHVTADATVPLNPLAALIERMRSGARAPAETWTAPDPRPEMTTLPGRDHRSLLLFLQSVESNHRGDVRGAASEGCFPGEPNRMRDKQRMNFSGPWDPKHGTRYDDGRVDGDSDDWDCLWQLEEWGFIICGGSGINPVVALTDKGHAYAAVLHRARGEAARASARS